MTDTLPALLYRLNQNQLAMGAAIEELATWVEQRGSVDTAEAVKQHLAILEQNAEFIGDAIIELMADK
ncbi:hypothetical protein ACE0DR_06190 [Azotobacter sp. CWF10]